MSIIMIGLSGVDIQRGTFDATFYLEISCPQECDSGGWEFVNATSISSEVAADEPGSRWWRVMGTFVFQPDLRLFPFDTQRLPLVMEHKRLNSDDMVFVPDMKGSEVSQDIRVPGWIVEPFTFSETESKYSSLDDEFSRVTFSVPIGRSAIASVTKFYVPLLIFILLGAATLVIARNDIQLRTGGTALVGLTIFYLATSGGVGAAGYLTLWDISVIIGYLALGLVLVAGVIGSYLYSEKAFEGEDGDLRNKRLRFRFLGVVVAVIVVGAVIVSGVAVLT